MRLTLMMALVCAAAASACGGGGGGGDDPLVAILVGAWDNTTGQSTQTCGSAAPQSAEIPAGSFTFTITRKDGNTVTMSTDFDATHSCVTDADVSGQTATLQAGQACTIGTDAAFTFKSGTVTVNADHTTASASFTAEQTAKGTTCNALYTFGLSKKP